MHGENTMNKKQEEDNPKGENQRNQVETENPIHMQGSHLRWDLTGVHRSK